MITTLDVLVTLGVGSGAAAVMYAVVYGAAWLALTGEARTLGPETTDEALARRESR